MHFTNILIAVDTTTLYPPTPISTANSRRAPARVPAPRLIVAVTFPSANGTASHGCAPRTEAAATRTPYWMNCLVHRKQSALVPGLAPTRAALAARLMFLLRLAARKALKSSRSSPNRVSWRFNQPIEWVFASRFLNLDILVPSAIPFCTFSFFNIFNLNRCSGHDPSPGNAQIVITITSLGNLRSMVASTMYYILLHYQATATYCVQDSSHRNGVYSGYTSTVKSQSEIDKRSDHIRERSVLARIHIIQSD